MNGILWLLGALPCVWALWADQSWFDRHFMPVYFLSYRDQSLAETAARLAAAGLGFWLALWLRPHLGRATPAAVMRLSLAVLLALAASEAVLRIGDFGAVEGPRRDEEPRRLAEPRLGWVFAPARSVRQMVAGRPVDYSFDAAGYRVETLDRRIDFQRPTVLFTGESIMAGYGLTWAESIPGQVEALSGLQSADLAVFGYANDQAYLRLAAELPRFHAPRAVVSIFIPSLFNRNFGDDRPHLGPGLTWLPAVKRSRLSALFNWLVPYRSDADVERALVATRDVLRATADLARAAGAQPIIVVPLFGAETPPEAMLRRRILDEAGLPYRQVTLEPGWRLTGDSHPDARAARAIAEAIIPLDAKTAAW